MADSSTPRSLRRFSRLDAKRAFIFLAMLAIVGVCYWFLLPAVQSLIIPPAPGGDKGPWVVRPILAFHFGAVAVMAAATLPFLMTPLRRIWARQDAALGTRCDPLHDRPGKRVLLFIQGLLLLVFCAAALFFYLFSWTFIAPDGIGERLPWTVLNHSFQEIVSLETIPDGMRSESIKQDGPWYSVRFWNGRSLTLSEENEGTTLDELRAITAYIADRSGVVWARRIDARAR